MPSRTARSLGNARQDSGSDGESLNLLGDDEFRVQRLGDLLRRVALGLTVGLMLARAFWPGEDATEGTGLPWVGAQLAALALAVAASWCEGGLRYRWSLADGAFLVLVGLVAWSSRGAVDRRAAVAVAWEWGGLAALYVILRSLPRTLRESSDIAGVLVALSLALSTYGFYQIGVEDPDLRDLYRRQPEQVLRMAGVSNDPVSRTLFEQRLLASREPRSTQALANSLAGMIVGPAVLGAGFLLFVMLGRGGLSPRPLPVLLALLVLVPVIACLLLTKSRSAYLGFLVGLAVFGWSIRGRVSLRMIARGVLGVALFVGLMVGIALAYRGLDREVLTESTKSLRYRLEYWQGAWSLVTESASRFWGGVGPGNFAGPYLRHKLPTSSEEIVDPHNLLLEVWATSGFPAAVALVTALGLALWNSLGASRRSELTEARESQETRGSGWLWFCGLSGCFLAVILGGLDPSTPDGLVRWLILGWSWAIGAIFLQPFWRGRVVPGVAAGAGCLAVAVNLLGAGGISMPPVAMSLWALAALGQNLRDDRVCGSLRSAESRWVPFAMAFPLVAILGTYSGACLPALRCMAAVSEGQGALGGLDPDAKPAREAFFRAARLDPLSSRPWMELADLELEDGLSNPDASLAPVWIKVSSALDRALALPRNPLNIKVLSFRIAAAKQLLERLGDGRDPMLKREIQEDLTRTALMPARLYPSSPTLRANLALAAATVGQVPLAIEQAQKALELDAATPHLDKKLTSETRANLLNSLPQWIETQRQPKREAGKP